VDYKLAPLAEDDAYDIAFAGNVQLPVTDNDMLPDDYSINVVQSPQSGTLTTLGNQGFNFQADINFSGNDLFIYELCSEGCECSAATVTLTIGADATCDVPTIITPNNDNVNDIFVIPCLTDSNRYPNNSVAIFNQWGDEVFRAAPYNNNWAGTYDGEPLPSGTYFFVVDYGNGDAPQSGFLIIQQ
jgi:gliding motility-associated-like protein